MATGITKPASLVGILLVLAGCIGNVPGTARGGLVANVATRQIKRRATPPPQPTTMPTPDPDVRLFPETKHTLRGHFRRFWEQHGGLAAFGMPLTEPVQVDGMEVQYFERARFESPDGTTVALGRLGYEALLRKPVPIARAVPQPGCRFFTQTGHNLCPPLLEFWNRMGGVAILGYPLEEAAQTAGTLRQSFERARVEAREGQAAQLARIGAEALMQTPGGALLRTPGLAASPRHTIVIGQSAGVAPLEQATVRVRIAGYSGPAEIVIADRNGVTGKYPVQVEEGTAEAHVEALGAEGSQAALVMIGDQIAGIGANALTLRAETSIRTGQPRFDQLLPTVQQFMAQDTSNYVIDGHYVHGYRSPDSDLLWLRDHVYQAKGYAYWERDMTSLLDQFRRFQHPDGSFDDYVANKPWGVVRGRTEVEADLEYLFIEGVYRAWQATGDDDWLRAQVDAMERGLQYIRTSPLRWDEEHQLVKRPFTVDTWDFEYGSPTVAPDGQASPRHWIDKDTKWCIFYGDNTGYANSMDLLARMLDHLGNAARAAYWRGEANGITTRLNALAWNGSFYRHMVHLTPVDIPGVDEARQLSLSNAFALNRSGITQAKAEAIIREYQRRYQARGTTFSEWYSIDPPFPAGSLSTSQRPGWGKEPGEYVNGGMMPLVGGELARGSFSHGAEAYGFDILQRYYSLIAGTGGSYLWYFPVGQPGKSGPDSLPTDGWGSSAMLAALIEGAAGARDDSVLFQRAMLAPRWTAAGDVTSANVTVRYGASDGYIAYRWEKLPSGIRLRWTGSGDTVHLQLLLPQESPKSVQATLDGQPSAGTIRKVGRSRYWEADVAGSGTATIHW